MFNFQFQILLWLLLALSCQLSSFAQDTYPLTNDISIQECEGFFTDSDAGLNGLDYGHNEDYTFTTCIPGSDSIRMTFFTFCTEAGLDVMTFHDGPNANSPIIFGPHSGLDLPPDITATSGCLTITWVSDASVACTGWNAYWETFTTEPEPPLATFNPTMPTCSTEVVTLTFSAPVPCDSVYPDAFTFTGIIPQTVTDVTPLNCTGGQGTSFQLTLSPGLDRSGSYAMEFVYEYEDLCGEIFTLEVNGALAVNDCPIQVEVFVEDDAICPGGCTEVWAEVTGGDPSTYVFSWSNGLPSSAGPHLVCPMISTTYSLTVSDAGPAAAASDQQTVTVLALPMLAPVGPVCENDDAFQLTATPSGGTWSGSHMTNAGGLFEPDTGAGMPWAVYTAPNGCADSIQVTVYQVWAGWNQASCPGAAPFQLTNAVPVGGTWSGSPHVTADGIFDPSVAGSHTLTYTTTDGCTADKMVNVDNITVQAGETVCESDAPFNLTFSPIGGSWSGNGIANWYWGRFDPSEAGGGTHTLTYAMNGCSETVDMEVTAINAGNDRSACPGQVPFQLNANPNGGVWSGTGVSPNGLFDPSVPANGANVTLTYELDGCTDTRIIRIRQTLIPVSQLNFCTYDDALTLNNNNTGRIPNGGTWSGPGVNGAGQGSFNPNAAGAGMHTIYYTANTCVDSMTMVVNVNQMVDTSICEQGAPIALQASPAGGEWYGDGIIDQNAGMFSPAVTGAGIHWVYYQAPTGCWDSLTVDVYQLEPAVMSGLSSTYCFRDTAYLIDVYPEGGTLSGSGTDGLTFNPALAGEGIHQIRYEQGAPGCVVFTTRMVSVSAPIVTIEVGQGSGVCPGEAVTVGVQASGGNGSALTYAWEPNVTWFASTEIYPDTATTYVITTSDGCSDPVTDSVTVTVHPQISAIITTSDTLCYGETGYATVTGQPTGSYRYDWQTNPTQSGPTLYAQTALSYMVTVTDIATGCTFDTSAAIPSYPNVVAFFTPNPNGNCLGESNPVAEFLDLSQGAFSGTWDFGDGTVADYIPGIYPTHTYPDTGTYPVTLYVENAFGTCTDEVTFDICVAPEFTLFIPNAFTPDGDGLNDLLEIVSSGITDFEFIISSRWGIAVHTQTDPDGPFWDGTFRGSPVPQGVYSYWVYARALDRGGVVFVKDGGSVTVVRNGE